MQTWISFMYLCLCRFLVFEGDASYQNVPQKPEVFLELGAPGSLHCQVDENVRALPSLQVEWLKGSPGAELPKSISIVVLIRINSWTSKGGPGYEEKRYDIDDELSLNITSVRAKDIGRYFCRVVDRETDIVYTNQTDVLVFAFPSQPFPIIDQCLRPKGMSESNCTIYTLNSTSLNITCSIPSYFPNADLIFRHGSTILQPLETREWSNANGTINKLIIVEAASDNIPYECVASNLIGPAYKGDQIATIWIQSTTFNSSTDNFRSSREDYLTSTIKALMAILVVSYMVFLSALAYVWKRTSRKTAPDDTKGETQELLTTPDSEDITNVNKEGPPITVEELRTFVLHLTERHCRRLEDVLSSSKVALTKSIEVLVYENCRYIFDTEKMLMDWLAEQECNSYKKRLQIRNAVTSVRGKNWKDWSWICDNELRQLANLLIPSQIPELFKRLDIDEGFMGKAISTHDDVYEVLRKWRDYGNISSASRKKLYSTLHELHFSVSVLTDEEISDVCRRLNQENCALVRDALGIARHGEDENWEDLCRDLKTWRVWDTDMIEAWKRRYTLCDVLTRLKVVPSG